jgi:hypothetical protein
VTTQRSKILILEIGAYKVAVHILEIIFIIFVFDRNAAYIGKRK